MLFGVSKSRYLELHAVLESEFMKGMLYYGVDKKVLEKLSKMGAEDMVNIINSIHSAYFNPKDDLKAFEKLYALQKDIKVNNIYNQAFIKKDSKLLEFLKQNEILCVRSGSFSIELGDVFCGSGGFMDRFMDLFSLDNLEEFKAGYLDLKQESYAWLEQNDCIKYLKEKNTQENSEKEPFKPIEVTSDNIRDGMEDILSKLDRQKSKMIKIY